jgi:hypothetical protein
MADPKNRQKDPVLELGSTEINEACWVLLDELTKLGVKLTGHTYNNLKPAFYKAYLKTQEKPDENQLESTG